MPKIARKTQKILGGNSSDNGQFGSAQAGTKILSNDPDVIQSLPAWGSGWNSATVSGLQLPTLEEMQGVQYVQTYQLAYLFQEGIPEYDAGTTYYHYSVVKKASSFQLYGSLVDNNVGHALTDPTKWVLLFDLGKLNNYTATTNPTINDDSADGYGIGSVWFNQTLGGVYFCFDATVGAAVWKNPASPEFADNEFRIKGSADATKKLAFEVSGISTATTRTLTVTDTSLSIPASAAGPSSIVLAEATDNGANTVSIKSPTAVTSDRVQTLQDSSGVLALTSNAGVSVSGLIIQNNSGTPNTKIDISATDVVMGDTSGNTVRSINVSVTINAATTGANGLDAGSLSNSTWYYIWLISNGTTTSGLVSASSTAPTMPSGYTYKKRVGSFITDGSATFKRISQKGSYASYVPTATTNTTSYPTYGASPVSIYSLVPPTCELACITNNQAQGSSAAWYLNTSPNNTQLVSGGAWSGVGFAANSVTWFVPVQSTMAYSGAAPLAVGWKDSV